MSRGINKALVDEYMRGDSIPVIAERHGIPRSTVRYAANKAGVLRSRADGVRLAGEQGRLGYGMRGLRRRFTDEHRAAISRSARERGAETACGESIKPNGYVEITRGPHKGCLKHRVVAEQMLGRPLNEGEVVHHKDHNRSNNDPSNLEVMTSSEHSSLHRKGKI